MPPKKLRASPPTVKPVPSPLPLTKREKEIIDWLQSYIDRHQQSPKVAEIRDAFRISSGAKALAVLDAIARKGWIKRESGRGKTKPPEITILCRTRESKLMAYCTTTAGARAGTTAGTTEIDKSEREVVVSVPNGPSGRLTWREAMRLAGELVTAARAAHAGGVMERESADGEGEDDG